LCLDTITQSEKILESISNEQHNDAMQRRPVNASTANQINRPARADRERSFDEAGFEPAFRCFPGLYGMKPFTTTFPTAATSQPDSALVGMGH
jgi:hypothetical protein